MEMTTFDESEHGYTITYPKKWVGRIAPKGDFSSNIEEYYISPEEIPYGPSPLFQITLSDETIKDFLTEQASQELKPVVLNGVEGYRSDISSNRISFMFFKNKILYCIIQSPSIEYKVGAEEI